MSPAIASNSEIREGRYPTPAVADRLPLPGTTAGRDRPSFCADVELLLPLLPLAPVSENDVARYAGPWGAVHCN